MDMGAQCPLQLSMSCSSSIFRCSGISLMMTSVAAVELISGLLLSPDRITFPICLVHSNGFMSNPWPPYCGSTYN